MESISKKTVIERLQGLVNNAFNLELSELKQEEDYIKALKICQNIREVNSYQKILFILFEVLFIQDGKFKNIIEENNLKLFDICLKGKMCSQDEKNYLLNSISDEIERFSVIFPKNKNWPQPTINLICLLDNKAKEDFSIIFRAIEALISNKNKFYIPNINKYDFSNKSSDELICSFFSFLSEYIEDSHNYYFSIIYDEKENEFKTIEIIDEITLNSKNSNYSSIKELKNIIKSSSVIKKEIKNEIKIVNKEKFGVSKIKEIDSNNNNKKEIQKLPNKGKEEIKICEQFMLIGEPDNKYKNLEEKIELLNIEFKNSITELKQDNYSLKLQNKTYDSKIKRIENENKLIKENNSILKDKFSLLSKEHQNQKKKSEEENLKIKMEIKDIKHELNSIKSRNLIKCLLDYFYSIYYGLNFDIDYKEKKDAILEQISKEIK